MTAVLQSFLWHVGAPLVTGLLCYAFARPAHLRMHDWVANWVMLPTPEVPPAWGGWISGWLPDAAWAYAGTWYYCHIWRGIDSLAARVWRGLIPTVAVCAEIGQWVRLLPGTFDGWDLLFTGMAIIWATRNAAAPLHPSA